MAPTLATRNVKPDPQSSSTSGDKLHAQIEFLKKALISKKQTSDALQHRLDSMSSLNEKSFKPSFILKSQISNDKVFDDYLNSNASFDEMWDKMLKTSSHTTNKVSSLTHHFMQG